MNCRVLEKGKCEITQYYSNEHKAVDIVGENYTLDNIIAHSSGKIIEIQDGRSNLKGSTGNIAYGNYIKLEHNSGYQTLYAHLKSGLNLKLNQYIDKGKVLGLMGDSGNAYGAHLHFEVWKDGNKINPLEFLNEDLPTNQTTKYNIGDIVSINGVYISSQSQSKLRPLITRGKITKIINNANNPYLLDEGKIGGVNDNVIISKDNTGYLSNKSYQGTSIVDALKEINIDSSYTYRTKLASINNISNYRGTEEQNIELLNLLKQGILKY